MKEIVSTIQLSGGVIQRLKEAKEYPRQTYNELLEKMTRVLITLKKIINMMNSCIKSNSQK